MTIAANKLLEKQQHVFKEAIEITHEPGLNPISKLAPGSKDLEV